MSELKPYSFDQVAVTLDGTQIDDFYQGNDVFRVSRRVPRYGLEVGSDGAGVLSRNADRSAEVTLKLLQTGASNAKLTAKLTAQDAGLIIPFPFGAIDMNGGDIVFSESAFVAGPPDFIRGAGPNAVEWTLILHNCDILHLGAGG